MTQQTRHGCSSDSRIRQSRGPFRSHKMKQRSRGLLFEPLEDRRLLAVDWRNPVNSLDVSGDGFISPLDALQPINELNDNGSHALADQRPADKPYWDASGDQFISPLDALQVINALNSNQVVPYVLGEGQQIAAEQSVTITVGQDTGTRTYRLQVTPNFDTTDANASSNDLFAIYLVDPQQPSQTLLDRGTPGTTLFTLAESGAEVAPSRVRWDGEIVEIDLSELTDRDTAELRLQLLSNDSDSGSRVAIRPLTNDVDASGVVGPKLLDSTTPAAAGTAVNLTGLTATNDVNVQVENVRFNSETQRYTAELRLQNTGDSLGRSVAVAFPNLPSGVTLRNPSGTTTDGDPYVNFAPAISRGGLVQNSRSEPLIVEFDDPTRVPFALVPQILAGTNQPPTLAAIGPLTVMPGGQLATQLTAADPDGDAIIFSLAATGSASALPDLPTGTLRANGLLEFTPAPDQLGSYTFDVVASDGALEARQTVTLDVVADPNTNTRVSGFVLDVDQIPLAGMQVEIGAVQGLTLSDGSFTLDLGSGPIVGDTLKVRGETFPGPLVYPFIAEKLAFILEHEVFTGVNNIITRPIFLPPLDVAGGTVIDPMQDTLVEQEVAPGEMAEVFVAAGTLMNQQGTPFTGTLSITEVPTDLTPAALPNNLFPDLVVTIQPGEMAFATPAPLTLPNRAGPDGEKWVPGTLMDLWSINPVTGEFDDVGDMRVSADGTRIETISGGVRNSSWHGPVLQTPAPNPKPDGDGCQDCKTKGPATSVVDYHSGELTEMHQLPTYESQGESRGVRLVYNSLNADPRPILHVGYDDVNPNMFSVPSVLKVVARAAVNVNGVEIVSDGFETPGQFGLLGGENFWSIPAGGGPLDVALQVNLTDQPTGVYPYEMNIGLRGFTGTRFIGSGSIVQDRILHVNTIASPFGAGWGMAGLQEVFAGPLGEVLLVDGEGGELLYEPPRTLAGPFVSPPGDFSTLEKLPDSTFRRTMTDQTIYTFNAQGKLTSMRDRNGNETRYEYNAMGDIVKMIDPVGLETSFAYTGDCGAGVAPARACSITDPAGRVTQLEYDAAGNLTRITDPDGSQRTWEYDARHHMIAEVDRRGIREQSFYDQFGRFERAVRADGSLVHLSPGQTRGLFPTEQTSNPGNAPPAARTANGDAFYVGRNGNVISTQLDVAGQEVTSTDNIGPLPSVERNDDNLIVKATDARGHSTFFTYDAKGNITSIQDDVSMPLGVFQTLTFDPTYSQITSETDELGHQTLFDIDPANGNVRSMTEVVGQVDSLANGETDDVVTQFTYTPQGLVDTMTDPLGHVTDYDYDLLGRLTQITSALGTPDIGIRRYEHDSAGNQAAMIDENGHRTEYEYDSLNRLIRAVEPDPDGVGAPLTSPVTALEYDAAGNVLRVTDARGNVTRYEYDSLDRQTKAIDPISGEMRYRYDANDNRISMIDELGHETEYHYDARDRLIETIDPEGDSTRFKYDLEDNLTALIDPLGNRTEYAYDARSRTIRETQRIGVDQVVYANNFETDAGPAWSIERLDRTPVGDRGFLGQFSDETVALELNDLATHDEVTVSFDLFLIRGWAGNHASFVGFTVGPAVWDLNVAGGPTLLHTTFSNFASPDTTPCGPDRGPDFRQAFPGTFPGGDNEAMTGTVERKSLGYDTTNGECDPRSSVYHFSFTFPHNSSDLAFNFSAQFPRNNTPNDPTWGLDNVSVSIQRPGHSTQYAYDATNNLAQMTDRNNRVTQFAYDDLDRLTTESWIGDGTVIQYAYDKASNLTAATDNVSALAYTYDARNRVATVDNAGTPNVPNVVLSYLYDPTGNLLSAADAIDGSAAGLNSYAYDALDRMTRITQSGATGSASAVSEKRADFTYNQIGQFLSINRFSDLAGMLPIVHSTFEYDTLNRPTAITHSNSANPIPLDFFNFTYDAASRITQITDVDGVTTYTHDDRDQLTSANHAEPANPDEAYAYDANGNRISSHLHGSGYETSVHNRLFSDGTFDYQYDNEGNMILRAELVTGNIREFQWDHRNRLTAVIDRAAGGAEIQRVEFTYDVFNRRVTKSVTDAVDTVLTHFVHDGMDVLLDFVDSDGAVEPNPPALARRYLHGPAVDQVLAQTNGNGDVQWHLTNHLGTVTDLVDNNGVLTNHLVYDSYGSVVDESNAAVDSRYLYTGREFDAESGLLYYRARYYDPAIGRFISDDPIEFAGGQSNLYGYVSNQPISRRDPIGLGPLKECTSKEDILRELLNKILEELARAITNGKGADEVPVYTPTSGRYPPNGSNGNGGVDNSSSDAYTPPRKGPGIEVPVISPEDLMLPRSPEKTKKLIGQTEREIMEAEDLMTKRDDEADRGDVRHVVRSRVP